MNKKAANFKSCLQPSPKVFISCRGKKGENNALYKKILHIIALKLCAPEPRNKRGSTAYK